MLNGKTTMFLAAMVLCAVSVRTAVAFSGPYIFEWDYIRDAVNPAYPEITPVPHPGHDYVANSPVYVNLYNSLYSQDKPVCMMLREDTEPLAGTKDKYALGTVMSYVKRLDIVLADLENPLENAQTTEIIRQVRANTDPNINTAHVANYASFAGTPDNSMIWPWDNGNRAAESAFYLSSGQNVANPNCYPYASSVVHSRVAIWGANVCPTQRSSLFWAPLEKFSLAKRNLPSGHLLIPWTARFIYYPAPTDYVAPLPPREDVTALIQHFRMRGADGYYRLASICPLAADPNWVQDPIEEAQNRNDMLNAWKSLDKIFSGTGTLTLLNPGFPTNKTTGVQWSGVAKGSKVAILISNLGTSPASISLPGGYGLPATSDVIPAGTHQLKFYDTILPGTDVCVGANGKNTTALYSSWAATIADSQGVYSYLKFDVNDLKAPAGFKTKIRSLKLKTTAPAGVGSAYTDAVYDVAVDTWTEAALTWANKPAVGAQLATWTTGVSPSISSTALSLFVEHQVNGDGVCSLAIRDLNALRTSAQYQHYYDRSEDAVNCFQLVVEYEPQLISMPLITVVMDPNDRVTISSSLLSGYRDSISTLYTGWHNSDPGFYGIRQSYLKFSLLALKPLVGYRTVVDSMSMYLNTTMAPLGNDYNDAFYSAADNWQSADITWATKPAIGDQLVSMVWPGQGMELWVTSASPSPWQSYAEAQANGDGVMSICIKDVDLAHSGDTQVHGYVGADGVGKPKLTITYHYELLGAPTNCAEAKALGYGLAQDLSGDCYVNFADFAIFAQSWLK